MVSSLANAVSRVLAKDVGTPAGIHEEREVVPPPTERFGDGGERAGRTLQFEEMDNWFRHQTSRRPR